MKRHRYTLLILIFLLVPISHAMTDYERVEGWHQQVSTACGADINCIALVKAYMLAESAGYWDVVGCAGLMQICPIAIDNAKGIALFGPQKDLVDCCQTGEKCTRTSNACKRCCPGPTYEDRNCDPSCTPAYDARYDPQKNIQWGLYELMADLDKPGIKGNLVLQALAYNAGYGIVQDVLSLLDGKEASLENIAPILADAMWSNANYQKKFTHDAVEKKAKNFITIYVPHIIQSYLRFGGTLLEGDYIPQMTIPDIGTVGKAGGTPLFQDSTSSTTTSDSSARTYDLDSDKQFLGALGTYSVSPGFAFVIPYERREYALLRGQVQQMLTCKDADDPCVDKKITELSAQPLSLKNAGKFVWQRGPCSEGSERVFDDLARSLSDCTASSDSDCLCHADLTDAGVYTLFSGEGIALSTSDKFVRQTLPGTLTMGDTHRVKIDLYREELRVSTDSQDDVETIPLSDHLITFYKYPDGRLDLMDPRAFDVRDGASDCSKPKDYEVFCVRSPESVFPSLEFGSGQKSLQYQFALQFKGSG